jgi:integrase
MASVVNDPGGRKRILFVAVDESRKAVRLGKIDLKSANAICRHVEALLAAKIGGQPVPRDTAAWLNEIGAALRDKLAAVGLVEPYKRAALGKFLDGFIANRKATAAPNTITNLEQAKRRLVEHFGADREMSSITPADAEVWAAALAEKYAPATAGRTIKRARQFFKAALRNKLVAENVFIDVKANGQANKDRQFHVDRDVIFRVIDAAPDAEWRLLIALSRFGGLRCPSEHLALRWQDLDWERNRFRVDSPKTGERWIPIFPELRPYLEECFELAEEGAVHVITRYRDSNANLRTTFTKYIPALNRG